MRVLPFVTGMLLVSLGVGIWSAASGAGAGLTVLRVVASLVLAQGLYLAVILLLARRGRGRGSAETPPAAKAAKPRTLAYPPKEPSRSSR